MTSDTPFTMPVVPQGSGYGNNGGNDFFGGNGAWWIIILFLFVFCGWGNNGWGNNGNGAGATDNYVLASDFATLQRQIDQATSSLERRTDSINSGLCDGFYAQNTTMLNGFGGVNQNLSNGFANVTQNMASGFANAELARANQQAAVVQQLNSMAMQLQQCCCDNREAIANTNYNMATQANGIQSAITTGFCQSNYNQATNTRDIIEAQNTNTRAILDKLTQQEIAAKDAQITAQNQQIFGLQLAASQQNQNAYLVNTLRPMPVPAYSTCNPWGGSVYGACSSCGTV